MSQTSTRDQTGFESALGRVASFGPQVPWQAALLLPLRYEDLSQPYERFDAAPVGEMCAIQVEVLRPPTRYVGPPRLSMQVRDAAGHVAKAVIYGDTREIAQHMREGTRHLLLGVLKDDDRGLYLSVQEVVPRAWWGKLRPVYPGKPKSISAATVRERVHALLPYAVPEAARFIEEALSSLGPLATIMEALGCREWTLEQVIEQAHMPTSMEAFGHAQLTLERIAGLAALVAAEANAPPRGVGRPLQITTLDARIAQYQRAQRAGFALTDEQLEVIRRMAGELAGPDAMRHLLNADVGYGKSPCYQILAASAVDAGARVLVMLPNLPLAEQATREFSSAFPDISVLQVTGDTRADADVAGARVIIGTTAVLHRPIGDVDLVVVDEQQKFDVQQRGAYVTASVHLLEISATLIPRSLALARYGVLSVSRLTRPHTPREVVTRIWPPEERRALFVSIRRTLAEGHQILLIYPEREAAPDDPGRRNVEIATHLWEEWYPGQVRALTGADTAQTKRSVIDDLREGRAQILVSTSLVEIGLTAPGVRRVSVFDAHRFGLSVLHQIRGRVARLGGRGDCDLVTDGPLSEVAQQRLDILCQTNDGAKIAATDLKLRGVGDLGVDSTRQSGADDTFLYGRPLALQRLEEVRKLYLWLLTHRATIRQTSA